jgi:phosphocarrier protein HPr
LESRAGRLYVAFRMQREVEIVNKLGLHARPASEFVRCVIRFKSIITICKGEESFSAASILEVLSADLDCGARVILEAVGPMRKRRLISLKRCCCVFAMKKMELRETESRPERSKLDDNRGPLAQEFPPAKSPSKYICVL